MMWNLKQKRLAKFFASLFCAVSLRTFTMVYSFKDFYIEHNKTP